MILLAATILARTNYNPTLVALMKAAIMLATTIHHEVGYESQFHPFPTFSGYGQYPQDLYDHFHASNSTYLALNPAVPSEPATQDPSDSSNPDDEDASAIAEADKQFRVNMHQMVVAALITVEDTENLLLVRHYPDNRDAIEDAVAAVIDMGIVSGFNKQKWLALFDACTNALQLCGESGAVSSLKSRPINEVYGELVETATPLLGILSNDEPCFDSLAKLCIDTLATCGMANESKRLEQGPRDHSLIFENAHVLVKLALVFPAVRNLCKQTAKTLGYAGTLDAIESEPADKTVTMTTLKTFTEQLIQDAPLFAEIHSLCVEFATAQGYAVDLEKLTAGSSPSNHKLVTSMVIGYFQRLVNRITSNDTDMISLNQTITGLRSDITTRTNRVEELVDECNTKERRIQELELEVSARVDVDMDDATASEEVTDNQPNTSTPTNATTQTETHLSVSNIMSLSISPVFSTPGLITKSKIMSVDFQPEVIVDDQLAASTTRDSSTQVETASLVSGVSKSNSPVNSTPMFITESKIMFMDIQPETIADDQSSTLAAVAANSFTQTETILSVSPIISQSSTPVPNLLTTSKIESVDIQPEVQGNEGVFIANAELETLRSQVKADRKTINKLKSRLQKKPLSVSEAESQLTLMKQKFEAEHEARLALEKELAEYRDINIRYQAAVAWVQKAAEPLVLEGQRRMAAETEAAKAKKDKKTIKQELEKVSAEKLELETKSNDLSSDKKELEAKIEAEQSRSATLQSVVDSIALENSKMEHELEAHIDSSKLRSVLVGIQKYQLARNTSACTLHRSDPYYGRHFEAFNNPQQILAHPRRHHVRVIDPFGEPIAPLPDLDRSQSLGVTQPAAPATTKKSARRGRRGRGGRDHLDLFYDFTAVLSSDETTCAKCWERELEDSKALAERRLEPELVQEPSIEPQLELQSDLELQSEQAKSDAESGIDSTLNPVSDAEPNSHDSQTQQKSMSWKRWLFMFFLISIGGFLCTQNWENPFTPIRSYDEELNDWYRELMKAASQTQTTHTPLTNSPQYTMSSSTPNPVILTSSRLPPTTTSYLSHSPIESLNILQPIRDFQDNLKRDLKLRESMALAKQEAVFAEMIMPLRIIQELIRLEMEAEEAKQCDQDADTSTPTTPPPRSWRTVKNLAILTVVAGGASIYALRAANLL